MVRTHRWFIKKRIKNKIYENVNKSEYEMSVNLKNVKLIEEKKLYRDLH